MVLFEAALVASSENSRMSVSKSAPPASEALADAAAISRAHILAIGAVAAVVFGWILGGRYLWAVGAIAGLDWFLINLMNRVTDLAEDAKNGIRGTARVARHARAITVGAWALLVGSIALGHLVWPALTPWRIAVQGIGLGYNYPIVPTLRGLTRFKEMYFWKNFGSALLFVLTGFVYPLAILHADGTPRLVSDAAIVALILFFIPFELTYEILYDLRDLEGDRAEGVPTYPVVHGPTVARRIIDGLLLGASAVLMAAVALGDARAARALDAGGAGRAVRPVPPVVGPRPDAARLHRADPRRHRPARVVPGRHGAVADRGLRR
jgi:4-hydroxybenzoate polyprenyltransferase